MKNVVGYLLFLFMSVNAAHGDELIRKADENQFQVNSNPIRSLYYTSCVFSYYTLIGVLAKPSTIKNDMEAAEMACQDGMKKQDNPTWMNAVSKDPMWKGCSLAVWMWGIVHGLNDQSPEHTNTVKTINHICIDGHTDS